jgi:hypothetical protein
MKLNIFSSHCYNGCIHFTWKAGEKGVVNHCTKYDKTFEDEDLNTVRSPSWCIEPEFEDKHAIGIQTQDESS